jgi:hypothetical protein
MRQITVSLFDETKEKFSINYEEGGKGKNVFVKGIDQVIIHMNDWFESIENEWDKHKKENSEKDKDESPEIEVSLQEVLETQEDDSKNEEKQGEKKEESDLDKKLSNIDIEYVKEDEKEIDVKVLTDAVNPQEEVEKKEIDETTNESQEDKVVENSEDNSDNEQPLKKEDMYQSTVDDPTNWPMRRKKTRVWGKDKNKVINNNKEFMFNKE